MTVSLLRNIKFLRGLLICQLNQNSFKILKPFVRSNNNNLCYVDLLFKAWIVWNEENNQHIPVNSLKVFANVHHPDFAFKQTSSFVIS